MLLSRHVVVLVMALLLLVAPPTAAAQASAPPWAACGTSADEAKPVRTFPARPPIGGPDRTFATLLCGNDRYGYRHVAQRHMQDWQAVAFYTGGNWRDLADFAITQTLTAPQVGYPAYNAKNDTWTYKTPLQIKDREGKVRTTYWPVVSVASRDGRIITSFPSRDPR